MLLLVFCSFWNFAFHCRPRAKNEALKQHIFTSIFRNCNFSDFKCTKMQWRYRFYWIFVIFRCKHMLPMKHGKQIFVKTNVFTAEVLLRDFRWRDLHSENNNFIIILIPTLHGKHNFEYVRCCPALLFLLWLHTAPNVHSRSCSVIAVKSSIFHMLVPR